MIETGDVHYAYVTGSIAYRIAADSVSELQQGSANGRCEADVTIVGSYS